MEEPAAGRLIAAPKLFLCEGCVAEARAGGGIAPGELCCGFCSKRGRDARRLVPAGSKHLCDECIDLALEILPEQGKLPVRDCALCGGEKGKVKWLILGGHEDICDVCLERLAAGVPVPGAECSFCRRASDGVALRVPDSELGICQACVAGSRRSIAVELARRAAVRAGHVCSSCGNPAARVAGGPDVFVCADCAALFARVLEGRTGGAPSRCSFCGERRTVVLTGPKVDICAACVATCRAVFEQAP
jgi:hypothetical protein